MTESEQQVLIEAINQQLKRCDDKLAYKASHQVVNSLLQAIFEAPQGYQMRWVSKLTLEQVFENSSLNLYICDPTHIKLDAWFMVPPLMYPELPSAKGRIVMGDSFLMMRNQDAGRRTEVILDGASEVDKQFPIERTALIELEKE